MDWLRLLSPNKTKTSKNLGAAAEKLAETYLEKQGLTLKKRNHHSRFGELDLIMQDGEQWVFIEVKYRRSAQFGGAISTISTAKQKKVIKTASHYLQQQALNEYNTPYRFDVVAIGGTITNPKIDWLKNAFTGA